MDYFAVFTPSIENAGECLVDVHKITSNFVELNELKMKNSKLTKKIYAI
jgi:hypothetical protein